MSLSLFLITLLAYLLGSISFAVIVSRCLGLADPRSYGSKNPGATNVLRSGHRCAAFCTLVLDAAKGFAPVFAVQLCAKVLGFTPPDVDGAVALAGMAALLGHLYPVFFRFRGGKGVATAGGVVLGIHWLLGSMVIATWLIVAIFTRYSSLAALIAALSAPVFYLMFSHMQWEASPIIALSLCLISALVMVKHAGNMARLSKGTEPRLRVARQGRRDMT